MLFEHRLHHRADDTPRSRHVVLQAARRPTFGVWRNGVQVPEEVPLLAEQLQQAGYNTAAFTSLGTVRAVFGVGRGFDHFDDHTTSRSSDAGTGMRTRSLMPRLHGSTEASEPKRIRCFCGLHLSDPHEPYLVRDAKARPHDHSR